MNEPAARPRAAVRRAFDWAFRNRTTGAITIAQTANPALWIFLAASLATVVAKPSGTAGTLLEIAAAASLAWWALDELLRGVNPWRRLLGAAVLVYGFVRLVGRGT